MMTTTTPTGQGDNFGLGIQAEPSPCGTAWGHQGSFHGYFSNAFTTTGGRATSAQQGAQNRAHYVHPSRELARRDTPPVQGKAGRRPPW